MNKDEVIKKLNSNRKDDCNEAVRLLVKVADNVIKDPYNLKMRTLHKNNKTVSQKILRIAGASECLILMGFKETDTYFTLPADVPIGKLQMVKDEVLLTKNLIVNNTGAISKVQSTDVSSPSSNLSSPEYSSKYISRIVLPPLTLNTTNPFLKRVETYFHSALAYENRDVQERARSLIPMSELESSAQLKLRLIQEQIKRKKMDDPDISIQDALILELLAWFKEDFFTWVDSPDCSNCGNKTRMSHMSNDPSLLVYTDRVELHKCGTCHQFTAFPRYNDLNILLETRRGRCGEWANTFTLFCRSMGWDARFAVEEGDHVWTEVYSITQKRWLHCDPCENICDTPLVYESGWKKQISYVMAYSGEEVQDVTWRYSSNHKEVLKRRGSCSEEELVRTIFRLRKDRQKALTETRKQYLTKRLLRELAEMLVEKKPDDNANQGRISGSKAWRLARGETQDQISSHTWLIKDDDICNKTISLRYSASLDKYDYLSGGLLVTEMNYWHSGAHENSSIFRKEEKDWKTVYLARKESTETGKLSWRLELDNSNKVIDSVDLSFGFTTFENGSVDINICSDLTCIRLKDDKILRTQDFSGSKWITVSAVLSAGKGDLAWQHAQLFRQSSDSSDFPFNLTLTFKEKS